MQSIAWQKLHPQMPELFFVPKDFEVKGEYDEEFKKNELFNIASTGVLTAKDSITIDFDTIKLFELITDFKK